MISGFYWREDKKEEEGEKWRARVREKEKEEECELGVTVRRRFSPERREPTIVGLTIPALLKGSTFYSH